MGNNYIKIAVSVRGSSWQLIPINVVVINDPLGFINDDDDNNGTVRFEDLNVSYYHC